MNGTYLAHADEVRAMFGLADRCESGQSDYAERFGAVCAVQGRFLRDGCRLNVPGPTCLGFSYGGTNVSVYLTEDIIAAAEAMFI